MKISELFKQIKETAGTNAKAELMKKNLNETIISIFNDTYDNQRKYYVHKFNKDLPIGKKTIDDNYPEFRKVLNILTGRVVTGNAAIELLENTIAEFDKPSQEICCQIIDRNLKIGLSNELFAKILGKEARKDFEVTLAQHLEKVKGVDPLDGTFYASRKCDGCRCLAFVTKTAETTEVEFLSRQGKPFMTLNNLIPAIQWYVRDLPNGNYVTDGELCKVDDEGNEDFQSIIKEIKRKDWTIADPCYQMFDFCTLDEFNGLSKSEDFTHRLNNMKSMIEGNKFKTIRLLNQERITSQEDFDRWEGYVAAGNWEGFMLRKDIPFETGRSKNLLKVKKFFDDEFVVKDLDISEMTTAEPGKGNVTFVGVKSLIIEYKGCPVHVGSGISKEQRIAWKNDPSLIIGKTITVKYFEPTVSQEGNYSLRFPTLKYVYENGRDC